MVTTSTSSTTSFVVNPPAGLVAIQPSPDLGGYIQVEGAASSLNGLITPLLTGVQTLLGYIIPTVSGYQDLTATISGFALSDISGYIVPSHSGSYNLTGTVFAIGPESLYGSIEAFHFDSLSGSIFSIEPVTLTGTISGIPYSNLTGSIQGFYADTLYGSISGCYVQGLQATFSISTSATLHATITGGGVNIPYNLPGYIVVASSSSGNLNASISGFAIFDLNALITPLQIQTLSGLIIPQAPSGVLYGSITPTGSYANIYGFIRPTTPASNILYGSITGEGRSDLLGTIVADSSPFLKGTITVTGGRISDLYGNISVASKFSLSGTITATSGGLLLGTCQAIQPEALYGSITIDDYYWVSSLPYNTYGAKGLYGVINGNQCLSSSNRSDLGGTISGIPSDTLEGKITALRGQYALTVDKIEIERKNLIVSEDWIAIWIKNPVYSENYIPIIINNGPLSDLQGSITAVGPNSDLSGSIISIYKPSVTRAGVKLADLINFKTGERKKLRVFFKGDAKNFYYSPGVSYPEDSADSLSIVVESYEKEDPTLTALDILERKINVKQCEITDLTKFSSIDEAIRYGIQAATDTISSELSASITVIGGTYDLSGTVSGLNSAFLRDLEGFIVPTKNDPVLSGSLTAVP